MSEYNNLCDELATLYTEDEICKIMRKAIMDKKFSNKHGGLYYKEAQCMKVIDYHLKQLFKSNNRYKITIENLRIFGESHYNCIYYNIRWADEDNKRRCDMNNYWKSQTDMDNYMKS